MFMQFSIGDKKLVKVIISYLVFQGENEIKSNIIHII